MTKLEPTVTFCLFSNLLYFYIVFMMLAQTVDTSERKKLVTKKPFPSLN